MTGPITKRQLGIGFIAVGVLGSVAVPLYDLVRHHAFGGVYQWAALAGCALLIGLGALLLPLKDRPA